MSKFNETLHSGPTETNFMGENAFKLNDTEILVSTVLTTFLSDAYYTRESEITERILDLVEKVGYEFSAKLALYARTVANMRSVSHLIAASVCKSSGIPRPWLRDFYFRIVLRPDDISEILCCYAKMNGIDLNKPFGKIPNSMKRGFRKALESLSPYQIDKYKMESKTISLVDLVNLLHPHPTQDNYEAYRRLMHGESLKGTYDSLILEKEMSSSCQNSEDEDEKLLAKHDSIVSVLKKGMPIMNLLRNLRNIILYAPDAVDCAVSQLTNRNKILKGKLLPFRFSSAYETVSSMRIGDLHKCNGSKPTEIEFESDLPTMSEEKFESLKKTVLDAIETAMTISCENIPKLKGNCAILIDHSGSVRGDSYGNSTLSPFSSVRTAIIGNLFGSMLAYGQDNVYVGMFGDQLIPVRMDRNCGILEFNSRSYDDGARCGGRTENGLYEFMKTAISEKKRIDNLIVFSDMEIGNGGEGGWDATSDTNVPFKDLFSKFRKINPDCLTVCCNIRAHSGTSVFNPNLKILNLSGWSNAIFDTISTYQCGKIKSLVEEIEKINLFDVNSVPS